MTGKKKKKQRNISRKLFFVHWLFFVLFFGKKPDKKKKDFKCLQIQFTFLPDNFEFPGTLSLSLSPATLSLFIVYPYYTGNVVLFPCEGGNKICWSFFCMRKKTGKETLKNRKIEEITEESSMFQGGSDCQVQLFYNLLCSFSLSLSLPHSSFSLFNSSSNSSGIGKAYVCCPSLSLTHFF